MAVVAKEIQTSASPSLSRPLLPPCILCAAELVSPVVIRTIRVTHYVPTELQREARAPGRAATPEERKRDRGKRARPGDSFAGGSRADGFCMLDPGLGGLCQRGKARELARVTREPADGA